MQPHVEFLIVMVKPGFEVFTLHLVGREVGIRAPGLTSKLENRVQYSLRVVNVCRDRFFSSHSRNRTIESPTVRPFEVAVHVVSA